MVKTQIYASSSKKYKCFIPDILNSNQNFKITFSGTFAYTVSLKDYAKSIKGVPLLDPCSYNAIVSKNVLKTVMGRQHERLIDVCNIVHCVKTVSK
jgi:hypothetical protein